MLWLTYLLSLAILVLLEVIEIESTSEIVKKPYSLIYFSAPDCRYCAAFNPDFDYISALYGGNENFQLLKVNGRKHKNLVNLFEVTSYPTLKLYDTYQKIVTTYTSPRTVDDIGLFIQEKTGAVPNFDFPQALEEVTTIEEASELIAHGKVLLVFVSRQSYDWSTYYYPNHFYQRLSKENPEIKFGIIFADEIDTGLMERYHIRNIPSAVLLEGDSVKIFNTLSTNQMMNYEITEEMMREFLRKTDVKEENVWFENLDALAKHADSVEFDGHKQRKAGMNVVDSREGNMSIDEEYELLISKIGL